MKYLVGFGCALLVMLIMRLLNTYVLKFEIPEFLVGWVSCVFYFEGMNGMVRYKLSKKLKL